jgi:hypothetical protein
MIESRNFILNLLSGIGVNALKVGAPVICQGGCIEAAPPGTEVASLLLGGN